MQVSGWRHGNAVDNNLQSSSHVQSAEEGNEGGEDRGKNNGGIDKTKNPGAVAQGYTEKWTGVTAGEEREPEFHNPITEKFTGGKDSSGE